MASLPIFKSNDKNFMLHQTSWKAALTPIINNEINQGLLITGIQLINGTITINHLLDRKMVGFIQADIDAPANYYRSQPLNDKTLTLTSNAAATIALWVF